MKIVKPSIVIESEINSGKMFQLLEKAGRTCYKSEDLITNESAKEFIKKILKSGHESVVEHYSVSVRVICDRGVTHEIVRHRIASYSQESTRYCNYSKNKFGNELTFIEPCFWNSNDNENRKKRELWEKTIREIEKNYFALLELGATPQEARSILPNSLKTEIVMTMNLREWRHFFKLRISKASHPQMREVAIMILEEFKERIPVLFDDIHVK